MQSDLTVVEPLNPVSAFLQTIAFPLSFLGGNNLPGECTIPGGC